MEDKPVNTDSQKHQRSSAARQAPRPSARESLLAAIGRTSLALPALPFDVSSLDPFITATTLAVHYGKHHRGYLKNVREASKGSPAANGSLEEIVLSAAQNSTKGALFNNAAQAWNHGFYWKSLTPKPTSPSAALRIAVEKQFGSLDQVKHLLLTRSSEHFGSGWGWLISDQGYVKVTTTDNADVPFIRGQIPLLAIDVWEHAYYLDYRNQRRDYVNAVVYNLLDWSSASERYERACQLEHSAEPKRGLAH